MTDEPARVHISLLIETDQAPGDVQLSILASLSDRYKILHTSVGAIGDDDAPTVQFVVCPIRGLLRAFVDNEEAADALAKTEGAVILGWTADTDHRGEVTA